MARRAAMTSVLTRLPQPCMETTSTTVWPRLWVRVLVLSARSLAEDEATGYSPPTPMPKKNCMAVSMAKREDTLVP